MNGWWDGARRALATSRAWGRVGRWLRIAAGGTILVVLVRRVGAGPFLDGVRRVDLFSVVAALAITALTTVVSAWRWRLIARGLGLHLDLGSAVAAYYRSQFLNSTLPGGVLGDVHRGMRQGQAAGDVARSLRSVVWDRAAGQAVQVFVAVVTLLVFESPVRSALDWVALPILIGSLLAVAFVATRVDGLAIVAASVVVVAGHVAVFLVAARAAGTAASIGQLLPLAVLVLLAMTVPLSVGGWGPREGVGAWAFAAAGLGAAAGVTTATVYGVLGLIATLPGAVVLWMTPRPQPTATREPVLTRG